jgi:hypothetical protein
MLKYKRKHTPIAWLSYYLKYYKKRNNIWKFSYISYYVIEYKDTLLFPFEYKLLNNIQHFSSYLTGNT